jgi:PAS domain S-box-containing protein
MKFVNDLIDSVPMALSVRGIDGRYTLVNRKWEQYYGITRQRAVGAVAREVLGITQEESAPREALDRAALERGPDNPLETPDFRYRGRRYASRRTAMTDARGRPSGVVVATVDVTEQRAIEEALATEQRRLALVVRAAKAGIVDWDGTTRTAYYSSRLKELLGYPGDADTSGWPDYFDMVHPDDTARVHAAFRAHVLARDGREFHEAIEYRLRRADGSYVWVQGMGVSVRDEKGFATRFIASITDITERRAQEEALRESVRLREEVDRISRHDLKTPLNTVIAVSRLLREERTPSAEDAELLSMVERAGYRLLNMVNLSLDLFKMEQETYSLHAQNIDLVRVVDTVVADLERHAASKDVTVRVEGGAGALALGEELLCYSILANLLKNAVEASPDGGIVTVSMDAGAHVRVSIHNRGAVDPKLRARFFEKYATARKSDGTGLGTYSARLMARVQHGELTMETSEREGTTLTLLLPRAPDAAAAIAPSTSVDQAADLPDHELPPMRVLVVDDDEYNRLVLRRYLASPTLTVDTAVNGREAVAMAGASPPDLIVMDLDMPVMDGFEAATTLRREASGRPGPVLIALSSHDDDDTRRRARAAGFDAYLTKPIVRATLRRALAESVRSGGVLPPARAAADGGEAGPAGPEDPIVIDPDLIDSVSTFFASRREAVDALARAIDAGARNDLRRLAHRLVGSFSLYGFRWAAEQCRRIEQGAAGDAVDGLPALVDALRRHLETVEVSCGGKTLPQRQS